MSEVRLTYWTKNIGKKLHPKIKALPPTSSAFNEHVKRAHYQAMVWKSAHLLEAPEIDPSEFGWEFPGAKPAMLPADRKAAPKKSYA